MPRGYRLALLALALLIIVVATTAAISAFALAGWPRLRGVVGGLATAGLAGRVLVIVWTEDWPPWLARLLGEGDPL